MATNWAVPSQAKQSEGADVFMIICSTYWPLTGHAALDVVVARAFNFPKRHLRLSSKLSTLMCRQHQDALVRKLVRETYERLLLNDDHGVQAAAFNAILDGSVQGLTRRLLRGQDEHDTVQPEAITASADAVEDNFQEDAELLNAVVRARPKAFAATSFHQLAQIALHRGDFTFSQGSHIFCCNCKAVG